MPSKRTLDAGAGPGKAAKLQRTTRTHHDGGALKGSLCRQCTKLDIMAMFSMETNSKDFGFLDRFMDAKCPFCTLIWDCIHLHWGQASPLDNGARPRLYVQSKIWASFTGSGEASEEDHKCRILLAVTDKPQDYRLNRRRVSTDKDNRFIIGEVEQIDRKIIGSTPARRLRREIGSLLDISDLSEWLRGCQKHEHELTLDDELFRGGFRLIDTLEERLVEMMTPCEYVALSYVWGPHDPCSLRTTKENLEKLKTDQALAVTTNIVGNMIPRTIRDAMGLCKAIGRRYLWVDCLCIVQDDDIEKQRLIHGMNHIYENASLTVIAAYGQDANTGLPGITARQISPSVKRYEVQLSDASLSIHFNSTNISGRASQKVALEYKSMDATGAITQHETVVFHSR